MMKESIADCVAAIRIKKGYDNYWLLKSIIESRELNIKNCFKKETSLTKYLNNVL